MGTISALCCRNSMSAEEKIECLKHQLAEARAKIQDLKNADQWLRTETLVAKKYNTAFRTEIQIATRFPDPLVTQILLYLFAPCSPILEISPTTDLKEVDLWTQDIYIEPTLYKRRIPNGGGSEDYFSVWMRQSFLLEYDVRGYEKKKMIQNNTTRQEVVSSTGDKICREGWIHPCFELTNVKYAKSIRYPARLHILNLSIFSRAYQSLAMIQECLSTEITKRGCTNSDASGQEEQNGQVQSIFHSTQVPSAEVSVCLIDTLGLTQTWAITGYCTVVAHMQILSRIATQSTVEKIKEVWKIPIYLLHGVRIIL